MVSPDYSKRVKRNARIFAAVSALFLTYKYWVSAPATDAHLGWTIALGAVLWRAADFVAGIILVLFVKRLDPPVLVDVEDYSKQAHYTAL
jgi:hypothetical protein